MKTCLVTDSQKLNYYFGNVIFNHTIESNNQHLESILLGSYENGSQIAKVFGHSELLVVDSNPSSSYAIIAKALRAGINVLSPNLVSLSSMQLQELITIAQEIGVAVGFLPNINVKFPNCIAPVIIDCVRESAKVLTIESLSVQIASDLAFLLTLIKSEPRKVKVYWLPLYSQPLKILKLIVDFNDNSVITYMVKRGKKDRVLQVELIADELEETFDIFDSQNKSVMIKDIVVQNVEYFMKHKEMMYPSGLVLKSKQIAETIEKKISF